MIWGLYLLLITSGVITGIFGWKKKLNLLNQSQQ
jgi:hypothetical protein